MHLRREKPFAPGLTVITDLEQRYPEFGMRFAMLTLDEKEEFNEVSALERAFLLIEGSVRFEWGNGEVAQASRSSCFDEDPWALHVPPGVKVRITGLAPHSEISCHAAENEQSFEAHLYLPAECRSEERGKGTLQETSTRIVRTIFDDSNAPYSNLVLGEVIDFPGKWSSYPPHHHRQPEIYYYRFNPPQGFGYSELGEEVVKTRHNSTVLIKPGMTHPQSTAPGYAMWYLWVIRHLKDDRYIVPTFVPEHKWVMEEGAVVWPDK